MNIHEFQAKELFQKYQIPVLKNHCIKDLSEISDAAQKIGGPVYVLKAQIKSGGRGQAGGIQITRSLDELKREAQKMLKQKLVTKQTGPGGEVIHRLLIEEGADIEKEFYLAFLINRARNGITLILSSQGGVDIEETASKNPALITKIHIPFVLGGISSWQKRKALKALGLSPSLLKEFSKLIDCLFRLFLQEDLSLLEINPLVLLKKGSLIALDAKVSLDSNAAFRHPDWDHYILKEESSGAKAALAGFSFIRLEGSIGCMVNGAGLAMATMDMIQLYGGRPANFLDVGGAADAARIAQAFKLIVEDPEVKGILVNIFGGIVRCDLIAEGIISSAKKLNLKIPLVVRLEGNASSKAKELLQKSDLNIFSSEGLKEAAEKIISLTSGRK